MWNLTGQGIDEKLGCDSNNLQNSKYYDALKECIPKR